MSQVNNYEHSVTKAISTIYILCLFILENFIKTYKNFILYFAFSFSLVISWCLSCTSLLKENQMIVYVIVTANYYRFLIFLGIREWIIYTQNKINQGIPQTLILALTHRFLGEQINKSLRIFHADAPRIKQMDMSKNYTSNQITLVYRFFLNCFPKEVVMEIYSFADNSDSYYWYYNLTYSHRYVVPYLWLDESFHNEVISYIDRRNLVLDELCMLTYKTERSGVNYHSMVRNLESYFNNPFRNFRDYSDYALLYDNIGFDLVYPYFRDLPTPRSELNEEPEMVLQGESFYNNCESFVDKCSIFL